MQGSGKPAEPSMEDILASIRKIISEEPAGVPEAPPVAAAPTPAGSSDALQSGADEVTGQPARPSKFRLTEPLEPAGDVQPRVPQARAPQEPAGASKSADSRQVHDGGADQPTSAFSVFRERARVEAGGAPSKEAQAATAGNPHASAISRQIDDDLADMFDQADATQELTPPPVRDAGPPRSADVLQQPVADRAPWAKRLFEAADTEQSPIEEKRTGEGGTVGPHGTGTAKSVEPVMERPISVEAPEQASGRVPPVQPADETQIDVGAVSDDFPKLADRLRASLRRPAGEDVAASSPEAEQAAAPDVVEAGRQPTSHGFGQLRGMFGRAADDGHDLTGGSGARKVGPDQEQVSGTAEALEAGDADAAPSTDDEGPYNPSAPIVAADVPDRDGSKVAIAIEAAATTVPEGDGVPVAAAGDDLGRPDPAGRSLEAAVTDLLRPMLREWLDENLPRLVEKALQAELVDRTDKDRNKA